MPYILRPLRSMACHDMARHAMPCHAITYHGMSNPCQIVNSMTTNGHALVLGVMSWRNGVVPCMPKHAMACDTMSCSGKQIKHAMGTVPWHALAKNV